MTTRRSTGRAIELLRKVDGCGVFDRATLAREMVITPDDLESFLNDSATMPLDRQLCLAQLVIERVPALSRAGHRLKGQVSAALAFNARVTETHADSPPPMYR
ncbi:MAG: hypothetical protein ABI442_11100 [Gemmatimonadaceae bacterium]